MTSKRTQPVVIDALAALTSIAISGCAPSQSPSGSPFKSPPQAQLPSLSQPDLRMRPSVKPLLPALLADAANRSGAAQDHLRVISAEAVTWADGALGCPQAGLSYMQVLVPGYRVRIATPDGTLLDYHVGSRERWLYCPAGRAQPPVPGGGTSSI